MSNQISVLKQTELCGRQFTVYGSMQEPLFVASDVALMINHPNTSELVKLVDDDEKLTSTILRSGQNREVWMLTESGLYEVLMQSRKPIAKQFKKGIKAILKEIRKTGGYISTTQEDTPELIMARALQVAQATIDRHKKQLELANERIALQGEQLKSQAPKVDYYDQVLQSEGTMTTRQLAMSIGMTANTLNKKLCNAGIQFRQSGMYILRSPYSSYNLTGVRSYPYTTSDGRTLTKQYLVWNERGKQFVTMLRNNNFDAKKTRREISPDFWMMLLRPQCATNKNK